MSLLLVQKRKREENIRKREEERKQKEVEAKRKRDQQKVSKPSGSTPISQRTKPKTSDGETRTKPKNNDGETRTKPKTTEEGTQKSKQQVIEDERHKAEDKLQRRLKKAQEKKQAEEAASMAGGEGQSYEGYENLHGRIFNVTLTKVCKKLGIAIDGGANTKQKAVIIREISVSGSLESSRVINW